MKPEMSPDWYHSEVLEDVLGRVTEAIAVLDVVQEGDLLGELPADADARVRHRRAVCLLGVLKRDLAELQQGLEATWAAAGAVSRATSPQRRKAS